ncbi:DUF4136 domain-containing protein [Ketobacter sp. MCCC 1A13808]|uniref:DUF4136 domain-containing protein n=1 Tax=Ketobacter sp. MCCC 1A13808 TaxID=2602738 RepID=UPI000F1D2CB3|nr:DUF4136 domain-containing protein [Ketobacter sp. MCCC 1A13808]MVF14118.1 DUF4136 domain-containing protein [Ketobacter sp. MCCC 1A13808]RLP55143.1 MAG: DUF4136 domain-containing protein [Ketobacter sp.]
MTYTRASNSVPQKTQLTCRSLILGAMAITMLGCASTPTIHTQSAPGVDISRYKTFAYISPLGTDSSEYGSLLSNKLKAGTRAALTAKGFTYDEKNPDMLVNFTATVKQKTDVESIPGGMGFRGGMYAPWGGYNDVYVRHYDDGTLLVDLIDAKQKQMVWQGTAKAIVHSDPKDNEIKIQQAITGMFEELPPQSE